MFLMLYALLLGLSLVIITVGLFSKNEGVYAILGFAFLFYCGLLLNNGVVEYPLGSSHNTTYSYLADNVTIDSTFETSLDSYSYFNDSYSSWFGRFLMIGSILGFTACIVDISGFKWGKNG